MAGQGTFSQQKQAQQQQFPSRTQRKIQQNVSQQQFQALQNQAQKLRETEFTGITLEQYKQKYAQLSPEMQQFFKSPQEITAGQESQKQVEKDKLNSLIVRTQSELESARQRLAKYNESPNSSIEERTNAQLEVQQIEERISFAKGESGKIDQGATTDDIWSYAVEKSDYNRSRAESRTRQIQEFSKQVKTGEYFFEQDLLKVGLTLETATLPKYIEAVESYNKDVAYKQSLQNWAGKVGFTNISPEAQKVLNPSAVEWQQANLTEKLQFDKYGNVTGVESGALGKSMSVTEYNKLVASQKTPEQVYSEWQVERAKKPYYEKQVTIIPTDTSKFGYVTRGTVGGRATESSVILTDQKMLNDIAEKNKEQTGVLAWISEKYSSLPTLPLYINFKPNVAGTLGISIFPDISNKKPLTLKEVFSGVQENIAGISAERQAHQLERTGKAEQLKAQAQEEYQTRFEDKYMKDLIYGNITFEQAQKQFESAEPNPFHLKNYASPFGETYTGQSKELQIVNEKYAQNVENELIKQGITKEQLEIAGLGLVSGAIGLVPTDVKGAVVTGGLVYTGYKAVSLIPASVVNLASGIYGVYGATKLVNAELNPQKRIQGGVIAVTSGALLGYSAVKWARTPTVKYKTITPKATLSEQDQFGTLVRQGKPMTITDLTGKATTSKLYKASKLSEQLVTGRRTIVSTKWRDLLGLKPIYAGIPTRQLGTEYILEGFRSTTSYSELSGYQKAQKLLSSRLGLEDTEIKELLRYYSPKVIFSKYKADVLLKFGDYYKQPVIAIKGTREITQPIRMIDNELGIQTRGATSIKEYIKGVGKKIGVAGEKEIYKMSYDIEKTFMTSKGAVFTKLSQAGRTTTQAQQLTYITAQGEKVLKVKDYFGNFQTITEYPYSQYGEESVLKSMKYLTPAKKLYYSKGTNIVFDKDVEGLNINLKDMIQREYGIRIDKDITAYKVAKPKLQTVKQWNDLIKTQIKLYGTPAITGTSTVTKTILSQPTQTIVDTELRTSLMPVQTPSTVTKIKELLFPKVQQSTILKSLQVSATQVKLKTAQSQQSKIMLKTQQIANAQLKKVLSNLQVKQMLKVKQVQDLMPMSRQTLRLIEPPFNPFKPVNPPTTKFVYPKPPAIPFFFGNELKEKIKRKGKRKKGIEIQALFPDFTARALGLSPKSMSVKQAIKEMNKIQTGFEIRKGGRIKGYSPIDEKSLLKGIMK